MDPEGAVRAAAQAYLDGGPADPRAAALRVTETGELARDRPPTDGGVVRRIHVLEAGSAAEAHVAWAGGAGFLTLLLERGLAWVVISAVAAPAAPEPPLCAAPTPTDLAAVAAACWDEYCGANRACDAARMAKVFHPLCRLTFAGGDGELVVIPCDAFLRMVGGRYATPKHAAYAHLRGDPRVAARDALLGVAFAAPDVAMVLLRVGHPPCLWTDLLTCARVGGAWWIVAKSSCSEPLLADEAREEGGVGLPPPPGAAAPPVVPRVRKPALSMEMGRSPADLGS